MRLLTLVPLLLLFSCSTAGEFHTIPINECVEVCKQATKASCEASQRVSF